MTDPDSRIARLETWKDDHEDRCGERYQRISSDTGDIKAVLETMRQDLKSSVERIHNRIDQEATTSRDATHAVVKVVTAHKIWILTSAVAGLVSVVAYLIDKVWKH